MAPVFQKQVGKLLGLLAEDGKEYGDLVADRLVKLVRAESLDTRDTLHRQLVVGAAPYLSHTAWYARVAAASCLESLARLECGTSSTQTGPASQAATPTASGSGCSTPASCAAVGIHSELTVENKLARGWVTLEDIRLDEVLKHGALLLSHGAGQDNAEESAQRMQSSDVHLRVDQQRKRLLRCLGLAGGKSGEARAGSLYASLEEIIDEKDLEAPILPPNVPRSTRSPGETKKPSLGSRHLSGNGVIMDPMLSARQRNRLGRHGREVVAAGSAPTLGGSSKRQRTADSDEACSSESSNKGQQSVSNAATLHIHGAGAFMEKDGDMIEVATETRGALVFLAADLVTQKTRVIELQDGPWNRSMLRWSSHLLHSAALQPPPPPPPPPLHLTAPTQAAVPRTDGAAVGRGQSLQYQPRTLEARFKRAYRARRYQHAVGLEDSLNIGSPSSAHALAPRLFHPAWQCRHGAALGALSILRAWNARRRRNESVPYGDRMEAWAEDAVTRCVCVLALDQFGDYSGRMVAPVRETAAQLLSVAALQLPSEKLVQAARLLCELTAAREWQARHGGFCGLESLCAVAIRGDRGGEGVSYESEVFLRHLVFGVARRGLSDREEDVCAAAARAVRVVIKRFLQVSSISNTQEELVHSRDKSSAVTYQSSVERSRGDRSCVEDEAGCVQLDKKSEAGNEEVFDLVWKALGALHKDSACVEDVAELLETCCQDVGSRSRSERGHFDPLKRGQGRLQRLLELWGDGRARVRAYAVRSLLALARGVVTGAEDEACATPAGAFSSVVDGRCERLLRSCFRGILFEGDEEVREHSARLWKELLPGMAGSGSGDGGGGGGGGATPGYSAVAKSCLDILFDDEASSTSLSMSSNSPLDSSSAGTASAASIASSVPSIALPSSTVEAEPSNARKRPRRVAAKFPNVSASGVAAEQTLGAIGISTLGSGTPSSSKRDEDMDIEAARGRHRQATSQGSFARPGTGAKLVKRERRLSAGPSNSDGDVVTCEETSVESDALVPSTSFTARVAAVEALAELVSVADGFSSHMVRESRPQTVMTDDAEVVAGPSGVEEGRNESLSGKRSRVISTQGKEAGARALVLSEASRRTRSGWAWERELGYLLIEGCGCDLNTIDEAGDSAESGVCSQAGLAARDAVDEALSATEGLGVLESSGRKVFRELESVDAAVGEACSGLIRILLQVASSSSSTEETASSTGKTDRIYANNESQQQRATEQEVSQRSSRATSRIQPSPPPPLPGSAALERTFLTLAAAFAETIVPLARNATMKEREAVWRKRISHFQELLRTQQNILATRMTAAAASAYVASRPLPQKLNPVLRPLISAVKAEPDHQRRERSASRLAGLAAKLLANTSSESRKRAGEKLLMNLAVLAKPSLSCESSSESPLDAATGGIARGTGAADALRHVILLAPSRPFVSKSKSSSNSGGERIGIAERKLGTTAEVAEISVWVRKTLAPLLAQHTVSGRDGGDGTSRKEGRNPEKQEKTFAALPSAASDVNAREAAARPSRELWAGLAIVSAMLQAARFPSAEVVVADPVPPRSEPSAPMPFLSALLLGTPLAAGLLALARDSNFVTSVQQKNQVPDTSIPPKGMRSIGSANDAVMSDDMVANVALALVKEAAGLCPTGVWAGLRLELLPALSYSAPTGGNTGNWATSVTGHDGKELNGGEESGCRTRWQGAHVLKEVVEGMGIGVVPFAARLLPVALRGMLDVDEEVRTLLAGTFNRLVKAVALASSDEDYGANDGNIEPLLECNGGENEVDGALGREDDIEGNGELIARHLVRGEPLPRLDRAALPPDLAARAAKGVELRPYQWEGVAWLDFLRRIGAHGILADDMGLGKTLQALMAVAMCHHSRRPEDSCQKSLVVCPALLVNHWTAECSKYFGDDLLNPIAYAGSPSTRKRLAKLLGFKSAVSTGCHGNQSENETTSQSAANVIVTSYSVLRSDAGILGQQVWLYLVMDEAHLLRNPSTRVAKAARGLQSSHRVGLTGTPIQNSVLELWSLFQFLMPGYLGDRRTFQRDVARPVRLALSSEGDGRSTVEGLKELEHLHRQVLPFVLRREKSEVLADLPPKIVTEIMCDLTPAQRRLHTIWEGGGAGSNVLAAVAEAEAAESAVTSAQKDTTATPATETPTSTPPQASTGSATRVGTGAQGSGSVRGNEIDDAAISSASAAKVAPARTPLAVGAQMLASLSRLQLLCVHPALVLAKGSVKRRVDSQDVRLSGKLLALRELLWDAGIGQRREGEMAMRKQEEMDSDENSSDSENYQRGEEEGQEDGEEDDDGDTAGDLEDNLSDSEAVLLMNGTLPPADEDSKRALGDLDGESVKKGKTNVDANGNISASDHPKGKDCQDRGGSIRKSIRGTRANSNANSADGGTDVTTGRKSGAARRREAAVHSYDAYTSSAAYIPSCKCLIFAQHKGALDVTESALLRPFFPNVKYLRVDGSVSQDDRAAAVDRFSADPHVALLLLTTRVGHLGLNLHAASMVVFLEHDWNPQVDLQAMDRAHRLGQRKAVNVYRLIAAESIEQRVVRLQGHKLGVAAAVVSEENSSAFARGTGQVLGMLSEAANSTVKGAKKHGRGSGGIDADNVDAEGNEVWSADEDYAYLAAERLADSVARE